MPWTATEDAQSLIPIRMARFTQCNVGFGCVPQEDLPQMARSTVVDWHLRMERSAVAVDKWPCEMARRQV